MPKINPEIETFARIKVIGVGGSGANAINHMIDSKITGVEFIAVNTDTQDLHHSKATKKIHIGKNLTKGLGSGMNPEIGRASAQETKAEIQEMLSKVCLNFKISKDFYKNPLINPSEFSYIFYFSKISREINCKNLFV